MFINFIRNYDFSLLSQDSVDKKYLNDFFEINNLRVWICSTSFYNIICEEGEKYVNDELKYFKHHCYRYS